MKITEFVSSRPAMKFTSIGDSIEGVISDNPELQPDKYGNAGDVVLVLEITGDDGISRRLYARKQMLQVIGDAVSDAGVDEIQSGGKCSVVYVDDKPTGGAAPMKVYAASYEAPTALGSGSIAPNGEDPWGSTDQAPF
jgi:hypothetical protein